jgi:hypothetical protein
MAVTSLYTTPIASSQSSEDEARRTWRRRRFWAAGLVAVIGVIVAVSWTIAGVVSAMHASDDFARANIPGTVNAQVADIGSQYVYYEGDYGARLPSFDQLRLQVSGPAGAAVEVKPYGFQMQYDAHSGLLGTAVATFDASTPGTYSITSTAAEPGARLAVGDSVAGHLTTPLVGSGVVLVLAAGAALALMVRASRPPVPDSNRRLGAGSIANK